MKVEMDLNQIRQEVKERNIYRKLLQICVDSLEEMPDNIVYYGHTHDLVIEIKNTFKRFE